MTKTVTGDFATEDAMKNAMDDLVSTGIPRENVFMDTEHKQLKVIIPAATEPEVTEILKRHQPTRMH